VANGYISPKWPINSWFHFQQRSFWERISTRTANPSSCPCCKISAPLRAMPAAHGWKRSCARSTCRVAGASPFATPANCGRCLTRVRSHSRPRLSSGLHRERVLTPRAGALLRLLRRWTRRARQPYGTGPTGPRHEKGDSQELILDGRLITEPAGRHACSALILLLRSMIAQSFHSLATSLATASATSTSYSCPEIRELIYVATIVGLRPKPSTLKTPS
jgi:hypothetical protein